MSWKFWKKSKQEDLMGPVASPLVPVSTLFRWYCYDLEIVNPNRISSKLGLSGVSEDVEEMEKEASNKRLVHIVPILPFLKAVASINATVLSEIQSENIKNQIGPDDERMAHVMEALEDVLGHISLSALIAGFSAAISLGVVHSSGIAAKEVDYEQF